MRAFAAQLWMWLGGTLGEALSPSHCYEQRCTEQIVGAFLVFLLLCGVPYAFVSRRSCCVRGRLAGDPLLPHADGDSFDVEHGGGGKGGAASAQLALVALEDTIARASATRSLDVAATVQTLKRHLKSDAAWCASRGGVLALRDASAAMLATGDIDEVAEAQAELVVSCVSLLLLLLTLRADPSARDAVETALLPLLTPWLHVHAEHTRLALALEVHCALIEHAARAAPPARAARASSSRHPAGSPAARTPQHVAAVLAVLGEAAWEAHLASGELEPRLPRAAMHAAGVLAACASEQLLPASAASIAARLTEAVAPPRGGGGTASGGGPLSTARAAGADSMSEGTVAAAAVSLGRMLLHRAEAVGEAEWEGVLPRWLDWLPLRDPEEAAEAAEALCGLLEDPQAAPRVLGPAWRHLPSVLKCAVAATWERPGAMADPVRLGAASGDAAHIKQRLRKLVRTWAAADAARFAEAKAALTDAEQIAIAKLLCWKK